MRRGPNGRRYTDYILLDTRNLAQARRGLELERFELTAEQRAARVEAYRLQVALAGQIVEWLAPPPEGSRRHDRRHGPVRVGRQRRWFETGRLDGSTWSPAFVPGG